jgi:hypothetical protein
LSYFYRRVTIGEDEKIKIKLWKTPFDKPLTLIAGQAFSQGIEAKPIKGIVPVVADNWWQAANKGFPTI